jgi:hypothetical protein
MRIHVRKVRPFDSLWVILEKDGWRRTAGSADGGWLSHPEAPDQSAARQRLGDLGLLTSRCLRIEFESYSTKRTTPA